MYTYCIRLTLLIVLIEYSNVCTSPFIVTRHRTRDINPDSYMVSNTQYMVLNKINKEESLTERIRNRLNDTKSRHEWYFLQISWQNF